MVTCETKLFRNNSANISAFYFTFNQVWNWNKIISEAERVLKSFQNYLSDIKHVGKYSRDETISANHSVYPTHVVVVRLLPISDLRPQTYFTLKMQLLRLILVQFNRVTLQWRHADTEIYATTLTDS